MKNNRLRSVVIPVAVVLVFSAAVWWCHFRITAKSPSIPSNLPTAAQPSQATSSQPSSSQSWRGDTYVPLPADRNLGYDPSLPQWEEWRRRREVDSKFEWKMPIKFYGKVVDQDDQPVQGAKVRFQWTDMSLAGTTEKFTETDAQGLFSLTNEKGKRLVVNVSKAGYHAMNQGHASFEYAAFFEPNYIEPDSNNPVIFSFLKAQIPEPMIQNGPILLGAPNDGTPTFLDLTTGRRSESGSSDFAVRINKGPTDSNNRFSWTAIVEGIGGTSLIESNEEYMVKAPTDGYQPRWTLSQPVDNNYKPQVETKFYVRTRDGNYARVEMRIIPDYGQGAAFDLTVYYNPSGSRNLEFDPAKVVKSP